MGPLASTQRGTWRRNTEQGPNITSHERYSPATDKSALLITEMHRLCPTRLYIYIILKAENSWCDFRSRGCAISLGQFLGSANHPLYLSPTLSAPVPALSKPTHSILFFSGYTYIQRQNISGQVVEYLLFLLQERTQNTGMFNWKHDLVSFMLLTRGNNKIMCNMWEVNFFRVVKKSFL